jgi:Zn-dependent protease
MSELAEIGQTLSVWFLPVVTAITLHEAAHAWVADRLGDDTARSLGRVSFNPIRHVDPFGTLLLPGFLVLVGAPFVFGWAKPVPVAFHRLRNPKRDMVWVALAGPGINIALAILAGLLLQPLGQMEANRFTLWLWENLKNAIMANVVLACFNMLPIPPLDGGRVLTGLLPGPLAWRFAGLERYGLLIVLVAVFLVPMVSRELGHEVNPLAAVLLPFVQVVSGAVLTVTGWGGA